MILFLSKYPQTNEELRDGFYQRVMNIDSIFEDKKKIYLSVSPYRNFKKKYEIKDENRILAEYNLFLHLILIIKLFSKANLIYIQSLHNLFYSFIFVKFFKKKYVLDLHGLVPEEFDMFGEHTKAYISNTIEKYIYSNLSFVIGVTHKLTDFYKKKHPDAKAKYIIYPILPNNLTNITNEEIEAACNLDKVNFIYSGNLQPWQNIDLMVENIKKISDNGNFFFQILTGNVEEMKIKFKEKNVDMKNINIKGVASEELSEYYKKSHYGFILRDDLAVNNVACPTKLIEYMNYGIIPIVLSDEIGDFKEMNYECISVKNISADLKPQKSIHNISIIQNLYSENIKNKMIIKELLNN